jgi:lysozyme family protein
MTFDQAFEKLIGHEGGYVNHPNDPGGETKFGISKRAYPNVDIKNLTLDKAKTIYKSDYWIASGCEDVAVEIRFHLFDAAVNSGVGQAKKWLQVALGVEADGQIGPKTREAIAAMDPLVLVSRYNGARLKFMASLRTWDSFGKGWARRIADNLLEVK